EGLRDGRRALQGPAGQSEALSSVVIDPSEPERMVIVSREEGLRESSEDEATARLPGREPAKVAVDQQCRVVTAEPAGVRVGRNENLRGDDALHMARRRIAEISSAVK